MLSRGYLSFHKTVSFLPRATGQSLCFYKNVSTVAIRQVSRKSNRSFTGTSRTSAISKSLFREIDVFPFGASILLICVRLRFVASASSACVSPRSLLIISNGQTKKPKLHDAFIVPYPCSFLHTNRRSACVFLNAYSRIYRKETM